MAYISSRFVTILVYFLKIRYNPSQKVFRCVDCDFVGFLSRVAEHWLGNHASPLRVFQCPRCPYTSAWARCVRMHLTRQHGETVNDNSMWKENPVLEEVHATNHHVACCAVLCIEIHQLDYIFSYC